MQAQTAKPGLLSLYAAQAIFVNPFLYMVIIWRRIKTTAQQLLRWATIWPQIDMGRKVGGCCVPLRGEAGSSSNTVSSGPRPTSVPSGILIHPSFWPQYTNVADRQTGQTTGPVA